MDEALTPEKHECHEQRYEDCPSPLKLECAKCRARLCVPPNGDASGIPSAACTAKGYYSVGGKAFCVDCYAKWRTPLL